MKKMMISVGLATLLLSIPQVASAGKPAWAGKGKPSKVQIEDMKKQNKHNKKSKSLPYGLQKKYERTGQLPPGWQKKLNVGSYVSKDILSHGRVLDKKEWSDLPEPSYSKIYEIEDKIIRINKATRVILDVLK